MKKNCLKPRLRSIPVAIIIPCIVLFLCCFNANAQRYVKYYDATSGSYGYAGARNAKVIETYDHNYLSLSLLTNSYNDIALSKYDQHGNQIYIKTLSLASSYIDLTPSAIAEDPNDHSLAITGIASDATTHHPFLLKTDKDGNLLWYKQWDGESAKAVLFSHDPGSNNNDIVVAGTYNNGGFHEAMVSIYNNSGTLVNTARYSASSSSSSQIDVADMVEIQGTGMYCVAVNYTAFSGTTYPAYIQFNYALTSANLHYLYIYGPTVTNVNVVAMTKYEPSGGSPSIYVLASCSSIFATLTPCVIKADLSTNIMSLYHYYSTSFNSDDKVIPNAICLTNTSTPKLMICGEHQNFPAGIDQSMVFTANLNLTSTGILHLHNPDDNIYKSVSATDDPNYNIISGDDVEGNVITRTDMDGAISCESTITWLSGDTQSEMLIDGTFVAYTYTPTAKSPTGSSVSLLVTVECGCELGVPKNTFSQVINGKFNTNDFLQADFDNSAQDIYIPSTIVDPSGNHNISVNRFNNTGYLMSSHTYSITNVQHDALASKRCANGDIVTAGRRTDPSGNPYLFVMRTNSAGGMSWYKALPETLSWVNYYVVITETTYGDIVVAGSSTLTNSIELVRMDGAGNVKYHDNVQVYAAGNPGELYPFIRAITATYDNGFVMVGTTGENNDFFGALVLKYDAAYTSAPFHTLSWSYIYRHKIPVYNLSIAADRSCAYASGVVQEPSNDLAIVGYVSNNDQFGNSATYENGFVLRLDPSGAFLNLGMFKPGKSTQFVRFNGISMAGLNYIITGQVYTPAVGTHQTMMMVTDPTMTISWANVYGSGTYNVGCSVFIDSKGFICAGVSNGNTTPEQPNIIQTDYSGNLSPCSGAFSIGLVNDANDQPTYSESTIREDGSITDLPTQADACYTPVDLCPASMQPDRITGIGNNILDHSNSVKMYPNPTSNILNIDLNADEASKGSLQILDMQGRVVAENIMTIVPGVNHTELDIANLKTGIYFVKVTDDKNKVYPVNKIEKY